MRPLRRLLAGILAALGLLGAAPAADDIAQNLRATVRGSGSPGGACGSANFDALGHGDRLVLRSTTAPFAELSVLRLPVKPMELRAFGEMVVVLGQWGLWVVDANDPVHPRIAGGRRFEAGINAYTFAMGKPSGTGGTQLAAIAGFDTRDISAPNSYLQVVDLSNLSSPVFRRTVDAPDSRSIAPLGPTSFAFTAEGVIYGVDASDPDAPVITEMARPALGASEIAARGDLLFAISGSVRAIQGFRVDSLSSATLVGTMAAAAGTYPQAILLGEPPAGEPGLLPLYIGNAGQSPYSVHVYDVANFAMAPPTARIATVDFGNDYVTALSASGDRLFAAGYRDGMQTINVADPRAPVVNYTLATGQTNDAIRVGGYIIAVEPGGYCSTYDAAASPADARPVARTRFGTGSAERLFPFSEDMVVSVTAGLFSVLDVSDPLAPTEVGSLKRQGTPTGGARIRSDRFVVAASTLSTGIEIFDLTDPSHLTGSIFTPSSDPVYGFAGRDDFGYMGLGAAGFQFVDFTDLDAPVFGAVVDPPALSPTVMYASVECLSLDGDLLAVSDSGNGMHLYDVSEPARPRHLGATPMYTAEVTLVGGRAYTRAYNSRATIAVFDVSKPESPLSIARFPLADGYYGVSDPHVDGDDILVALASSGFLQLHIGAASPVVIGRAILAFDPPLPELDAYMDEVLDAADIVSSGLLTPP